MEWVPLIPALDRIKESAKELLQIAGDPRLVRTAGNGTEFLVPDWVAEAFLSPPVPIRKPKLRAPKTVQNSED